MARTDPQLNLRIPEDLKVKIEESSKLSGRSINSEAIYLLNLGLNAPEVENVIEELESKISDLDAENIDLHSQLIESESEKLDQLIEYQDKYFEQQDELLRLHQAILEIFQKNNHLHK